MDNRPIRQRKQENKRKVLAIWQDNPTLTQVEIAALAGVSPPTVGRYFKEEGIAQKVISLTRGKNKSSLKQFSTRLKQRLELQRQQKVSQSISMFMWMESWFWLRSA